MLSRKKKTCLIYINIFLFFACQKKVEMKTFDFPNFSKSCESIDEDGRCTCDYKYKPCVFEDKSGDLDPYDDYKKCVQVGRTDAACCPAGWSYNENSFDVNCIGYNEGITGNGYNDITISKTKKKKRCKYESYPSCRKVSIVGNKEAIVHKCQNKIKPCNGRCYDNDKKVCHTKQTCLSEAMWNYGCGDAKTSTPTTSTTATFTTTNTTNNKKGSTKNNETIKFDSIIPRINDEENTESPSTSPWSTDVIIGLSVGGGALLIVIATIIGVIVFKKLKVKKVNADAIKESFDENPDYGYGEGGDVEIVDFNPYYMEPDADGEAEIVEYNELYGVGGDSVEE